MSDESKPQNIEVPAAADPAVENENTSTQYTSSQYTASMPPKRSWIRLFFITIGSAIAGLVAITAATLIMEEQEAITSEELEVKPVQAQASVSATDILALEMSGKIETAKVDPETLTQNAVKDIFGEEETKSAEPVKPDPPKRKIASVDKSPLKLKFNKGASKVSKNLNKSKVLSLLAKKVDDHCQPKLPSGTKSVKAEIKISKTGSISNIKVTPSSAEKELAKCMRKKLTDSKTLKPKDKKTAQVTAIFKFK